MTREAPNEGGPGEPEDVSIHVGVIEARPTSPGYAVPRAGLIDSHLIDLGWYYHDVYLPALSDPKVRKELMDAEPMFVESVIKFVQAQTPPYGTA